MGHRKQHAETAMNPKHRPVLVVAILALVAAAFAAQQPQPPQRPPIQLDKVSLPPEFRIARSAEGTEASRQMALAPDGTVVVGSFGLFSGNTKIGNVYALRDTNR